jgi:hypothetical protein
MNFRRILIELGVRKTDNFHTVRVLIRSPKVSVRLWKFVLSYNFSIHVETVVDFHSVEGFSMCA